MTTKNLLQQKIRTLESRLSLFKEQLSSFKTFTIEDAKVGDTLEDGSFVLSKSNGIALLMAPASTDVRAKWSKEFLEVFIELQEQGFDSSQWFVPTIKQLELAYEIIPKDFSSYPFYWSSTENNATHACFVNFDYGGTYSHTKNNVYCVRAFRCVTL